MSCTDDTLVGSGYTQSPIIEIQPVDQVVNPGDSATFTITVSGSAQTYQWYKNGTAIPGANSSSYTTPPLNIEDDGAEFVCHVTNNHGTTVSEVALLKITDEEISEPSIINHPSSEIVEKGQSITFSVKAAGQYLTYQWQENGKNIPGATDSSYTVTAAKSNNGSQFRCIVSNSAGTVESNAATLTVLTSSENQNDIVGNWILVRTEYNFDGESESEVFTYGESPLSMSFSSNGNVTYYERFDDGIEIEKVAYTVSGGKLITEYETAIYSFDSDQLHLIMSYDLDEHSIEEHMFFDSYPGDLPPSEWDKESAVPQIMTQPSDVKVESGGTATFFVVATGDDITFQWQKDGTDIVGATSSVYTVTASKSNNGSQFRCIVSNSAGTVLSDFAKLTVQTSSEYEDELVGNWVLVKVRYYYGDVNLETENFTISESPEAVNFSDNGILTYYENDYWGDIYTEQMPYSTSDGYIIVNGDSSSYDFVQGQLLLTFSIDDYVEHVHFDRYSGDLPPSEWHNKENTAPQIIVQPSDITVESGEDATFSVFATGEDLTYQWQKNGTDIFGATSSSFTVTATTLNNGSQFRCIVSNSSGTVQSDFARLTVSSGDQTDLFGNWILTRMGFAEQDMVGSQDFTISESPMAVSFSDNGIMTGYYNLGDIYTEQMPYRTSGGYLIVDGDSISYRFVEDQLHLLEYYGGITIHQYFDSYPGSLPPSEWDLEGYNDFAVSPDGISDPLFRTNRKLRFLRK
ncbi:hypothetical protein CHISP_1842 [Chitinispirillum alkaliphilum]|nr:hypothetical protein CHISP_1842 [Chitinispirillum alkaliphilum]